MRESAGFLLALSFFDAEAQKQKRRARLVWMHNSQTIIILTWQIVKVACGRRRIAVQAPVWAHPLLKRELLATYEPEVPVLAMDGCFL
jgi:hypothetical protein